MWNKHRHKIAALALVVVFALIALWVITDARKRDTHKASSDPSDPSVNVGSPSTVTSVVSSPIQSAVASPLFSIKRFLAEFVGDDLKTRDLQAQIDQLQEDKTRLIGVLQENERLRSLLQLHHRRPDLEMVWAQVIARDVSPYFRVLRIRLRSDKPHLVKPMMPVIVQAGVVGTISRVDGDTAEVLLASDPRSHIDVVSQRNRARGMAEGLGHSADYRARVSYVSSEDMVRPGDLFVTSGMGGVFPQNIQVGRVVRVDSRTVGLFQEVEIEPTVDVSRLEEVVIVVDQNLQDSFSLAKPPNAPSSAEKTP